MKNLILQLGNLLVIVHMAVGCNLHHGFEQTCGSECSHQDHCESQSVNDAPSKHSHASCSHSHGHDFVKVDYDSAGPTDDQPEKHDDSKKHRCECQHDGCHYLPTVEFSVDNIEKWNWLLTVPGQTSVASSCCVASLFNRNFDDHSLFLCSGVRAHLALGVQIV